MPSIKNIHIDRPLTTVSLKHTNFEMIGDQLLPAVNVKKKSDKYFKYNKEQFQLEDTLREIGANYNRIKWSMTHSAYSCDTHALEETIDDELKDNADSPINIMVDTTEDLTDRIKLAKEKRVVDLVTASGSYTNKTALTSTDRWDDENSNPIKQVLDIVSTVQKACGKVVNTMVIPYDVYKALKVHPDIIDKMPYTAYGKVTVPVLSELFEIEKILVPKVMYDTANVGQTDSLDYMWPKSVIMCHTAPRVGLKSLSFGCRFVQKNFQVKRYREEKISSDVIRVAEIVDEKLIAELCGYLIETVVS